MTATFQLDGQEFIALNGGPQFKFNEAISFVVHCETQKESTNCGRSFPSAEKKSNADG